MRGWGVSGKDEKKAPPLREKNLKKDNQGLPGGLACSSLFSLVLTLRLLVLSLALLAAASRADVPSGSFLLAAAPVRSVRHSTLATLSLPLPRFPQGHCHHSFACGVIRGFKEGRQMGAAGGQPYN